MPKKDDTYRYDAFLSYAHEDERIVTWLERVLERTWVPGMRRRSIYRDRNRIRSGPLNAELIGALGQSRYLIVCCSQDAVNSPWVDREIDEFCHARGTTDSHATKFALACQVGVRAKVTAPLPRALRWIQYEIHDELYLPDLRGEVAEVSERRRLRREALALLAPLVGLPDREAAAASIYKRRLGILILAFVFLSAIGTSWAWTRTDGYQVRRVVNDGEQAAVAAEALSVQRWTETLAKVRQEKAAVATARRVEDAFDRSMTLASIARGVHNTKSGEITTEAIAIATTLQDTLSRAIAVEAIVTADSSGGPPGAAVAATRARSAATRIENPELRGDALTAIAGAFAALGDNHELVGVAQEIAALAPAVNVDQRAPQLGKTALALSRVGDQTLSRQFAEQALSAAAQVVSARRRIDTLVDLASTWRTPRLADLARRATRLAAAEVQSIKNCALRAFLVSGLAPVMSSPGQRDEGRRLALAAWTCSPAIGEADDRARALASLAVAFAHVGLSQQATEAGLNAVSVARTIKNNEHRADVLSEVLARVANLGAPGTMLSAVDQASRDALAHPDDRGRSVALAHVSTALARMGAIRRARLVANQCSNSTDRLNAYRMILEEYHGVHDAP